METSWVFFAVRTEYLNIITHSSHALHEMNAYRAGCVCLSARVQFARFNQREVDEFERNLVRTLFNWDLL
jgi:hypothetical protein